MKTTYPTFRLPRSPLADLQFGRDNFTATTLQEVSAIGGMWSVASQWDPSKGPLQLRGFDIRPSELPGHGLRTAMGLDSLSIEDCIMDKVEELRSFRNPVPIVAHSLGCIIAIKVAEIIPEKVTGVICMAHAPIGNIRLPARNMLRLAKPRYLQALFGQSFTLSERDASFVADGSDAPLGPESGTILRQVSLGYWVPKLSELKCKSALMIPMDDLVVPSKTALRIASYHGVNPIAVNGGHFAFYDKKTREPVLEMISRTLRSWMQ